MTNYNKPRLCPGLPGGTYCGEPKQGTQGYCSTHTREYQRSRYQTKQNHNRKKGYAELQTRVYHKVDSEEQDRCPSCKNVKPGKLVTITNMLALPPICTLCVQVLELVRNQLPSPTNFIAIAEFILIPEHRNAILSKGEGDQAFTNEITRRLKSIQIKEGWDLFEQVEERYVGEVIHGLNVDLATGQYRYDHEQQRIVPSDPKLEEPSTYQLTGPPKEEMIEWDHGKFVARYQRGEPSVSPPLELDNDQAMAYMHAVYKGISIHNDESVLRKLREETSQQ